jgi:hypothetical protein
VAATDQGVFKIEPGEFCERIRNEKRKSGDGESREIGNARLSVEDYGVGEMQDAEVGQVEAIGKGAHFAQETEAQKTRLTPGGL